ncbi:MAG: hypothetical protein H6709_09450 [Kofleriaceae bacterium]|nr:hypothetical protein [Kofleriaceae bacterium]MCB9572296.1 hypothetical protein [Kofleriaceae bacterium]
MLRCSGLVVLSLIVASAACSFQGGFDGTHYRCGDGEACPTGQACVAGVCTADPATVDGGGGDDGGAPLDGGVDGAVAQDRCGTISLLADDFADNQVGREWIAWGDTGAVTLEGAGQLQIVFASAGETWAGYTSRNRFDLRDGELRAGVVQAGATDTVLELKDRTGDRCQLVAEAGQLVARVVDGAGASDRASVPYVPSVHRYWRMREVGGTLFWETSADQQAWTLLHAEPTPIDAAHVHGVVAAAGSATTGSAIFDSVNVGVTPALGFCAAATVHDEFASSPLEPIWSGWSDSGCNVTEEGGDLTMTFAGTGESWCGIETWHLVDLTASSVTLDAGGAPDALRFVSYFQVIAMGDDSTVLEIGREQTSLWFQQWIGGNSVTSVDRTYSASNDRFWRLREDAGDAVFETSGDGTSFTQRARVPAQFDLSRVEITIGAGHYGSGPGTPVTARFAAVNP